jgi:hypothetical protein
MLLGRFDGALACDRAQEEGEGQRCAVQPFEDVDKLALVLRALEVLLGEHRIAGKLDEQAARLGVRMSQRPAHQGNETELLGLRELLLHLLPKAACGIGGEGGGLGGGGECVARFAGS